MLPCHSLWKQILLGFNLLIVNILFIAIFAVMNWIRTMFVVYENIHLRLNESSSFFLFLPWSNISLRLVWEIGIWIIVIRF